MKNKIIILILLIQIIPGQKLICGNSKLKYKHPINIIDNNTSQKRVLNNEFEQMKIKVDYTQLKIDTKGNEEIFEIIKTSLDLAVHYFELLLSVRHDNYIQHNDNIYYENHCKTNNVDKNCENWFNDYNLILFPSLDSNSNSNNIFASANPCLLHEGRPIAGRIYLQNNFDYNKKNIIKFLQTILFHEITHILVFSQNLLESFHAIKKEKVDNETKSYIISPKALEKAKFHFGCNSLQGIPLEDQGGTGSEGSHWEGRYMLGDYMVSHNYQENVISDITLALFEDSGWYKPKYLLH